MDISTSLVLEESLYMTFTVKGNQMYYELDEPEDKDLTITIEYGDTQKTFHQSMVDNCFKQYGIYMFTFHTAKGTKLTVDFQENSLSFKQSTI